MDIGWFTQSSGDVLHTPPYGMRQVSGRNVMTESWDGVGVLTPKDQNPVSIKENYFQGVIQAPGPLVIYEASGPSEVRRAHVKSKSGLIVVLDSREIYTPDILYDSQRGVERPVKRQPTAQEVKEALDVVKLFKEIETAAHIEQMFKSLRR